MITFALENAKLMLENRSSHSREDPDPMQPMTEPLFAAVAVNGEADGDVIALLTDGLRVVRSDRQWIVQQRGPKAWSGFAYCATKEGLLLRIKEHLLKEHLNKLDCYQAQKRAETDKRPRVSKEALEATEAARALLKRGLVSSFGVAPEAWAVIEALPDYFPKTLTATA